MHQISRISLSKFGCVWLMLILDVLCSHSWWSAICPLRYRPIQSSFIALSLSSHTRSLIPFPAIYLVSLSIFCVLFISISRSMHTHAQHLMSQIHCHLTCACIRLKFQTHFETAARQGARDSHPSNHLSVFQYHESLSHMPWRSRHLSASPNIRWLPRMWTEVVLAFFVNVSILREKPWRTRRRTTRRYCCAYVMTGHQVLSPWPASLSTKARQENWVVWLSRSSGDNQQQTLWNRISVCCR